MRLRCCLFLFTLVTPWLVGCIPEKEAEVIASTSAARSQPKLAITGEAFQSSTNDGHDCYVVRITIKNTGSAPFNFDTIEATFSPIIVFEAEWGKGPREIRTQSIQRERNRRNNDSGYSDVTELLPNEERIFVFDTRDIGPHYSVATGPQADHFTFALQYRGHVVAGPFPTVLEPVGNYPYASAGGEAGEIFLSTTVPLQ